MMTLKLQIVIAIAILAILAVLVNMIRKRSLELKYALVWMMVLAALLIFDCAPVLLNIVSNFLGIYAPVNMIFFLGFCFSLLIIFSLTVALSRLSNSVRTLAIYPTKLLILTQLLISICKCSLINSSP